LPVATLVLVTGSATEGIPPVVTALVLSTGSATEVNPPVVTAVLVAAVAATGGGGVNGAGSRVSCAGFGATGVTAVAAVPANGELVSPRSSSVCASSMLGVKTGAVCVSSVLVSSLAYTGLTSKAASLSAFFF
jgi:hypothetical protein